jgi:formate/nitrite transporter FocA (FNT family)
MSVVGNLCLTRHGAPVMIGNTIGGVVLVVAMNDVQVAPE